MSELTADETKAIVRAWASSIPEITHVYEFGSRARGDYRPDSDFDIAIRLQARAGDQSPSTTWFGEGDKWERQLQSMLPVRVHLEPLDYIETPDIKSSIEESLRLIYQRDP